MFAIYLVCFYLISRKKGAFPLQLAALHFGVVCTLVAIAGFIDSIAGGGGLISLPAYLLSGLPVHTCIATNKLSSCMGTTLTTARYAKPGYIPARLAAFCASASLLGATLGARLALLISDRVFRILLLLILPPTALYVLKKRSLRQRRTKAVTPPLSCRHLRSDCVNARRI